MIYILVSNPECLVVQRQAKTNIVVSFFFFFFSFFFFAFDIFSLVVQTVKQICSALLSGVRQRHFSHLFQTWNNQSLLFVVPYP